MLLIIGKTIIILIDLNQLVVSLTDTKINL